MSTILIILIVVAAILLTLLVLVQNSKGGGLASGFASGNQVMGAPKTADLLEKATWVLIAFIAILSIFAVWAKKNESVSNAPDAVKVAGAASEAANEAASAIAPAFNEAEEEAAAEEGAE